ncbi:ankyrin repeat domain-containing protein [Aspergillus affinis]|uniref:ankyrin repeat domain-containing protein n=1 Tax=Aspergillus affinis TaxID=1070780 RepID=UPI0022FE52CD|nr:uncharacterized protein KD926_002614 [Aspergillus affinis]KAI9035949.1 hypothetical protein KD926_002614 [Aspergillus affinis]
MDDLHYDDQAPWSNDVGRAVCGGKQIAWLVPSASLRKDTNRKKQYETISIEWGFRKNKFTPGKWKVVSRKIQKRKRELGKDSEVYVDGIQYPPSKDQVGILKHGFVSMAELYSVPSPEMPEGFAICSPIPKHGLPNATRFTEVLRVLMPEECEEDHRTTTEILYSQPIDTQLPESLKLLFYLLSNNFSLVGNLAHELCWEGFDSRFAFDAKRENKLMISVIHSSGFNTNENMKHLLAMPGLTSGVLAEEVFGSAVRSVDRETITVMLGAGMNPQTLIWVSTSHYVGAMTPLEYFCTEFSPTEMVRLLLSHNASVNEYRRMPVLASAILSRKKHLISLFISYGGDILIGLEALISSTKDRKLKIEHFDVVKPFLKLAIFDDLLAQMLIDYGSDPNQSQNPTDKYTPLQKAVSKGNMEIFNLLLGAGADVDGGFCSYGTTALQVGVMQGNMDVVERLLNAGADVNRAPSPCRGATALQFASIQGFIGIVRRLLEEDADVNAG